MTTSTAGPSAAAPPMLARAATLCDAFQAAAAAAPSSVALRAFGDERVVTWKEYADAVQDIAAGLHGLGVRPGDTVGLMLTNRPEFHLIDTAVLHLGATPFSIYNTSSPEQIEYLLGHAECRVLFAEQQFVDRVAAAGAPKLEHVVLLDDDGTGGLTLDALRERAGAGFDFEAAWRSVGPDAVATLIYTSGTTGPPKGVELTHANVLFVLHSCAEKIGLPPGGRCFSYLPTAHMADRLFSHYLQMGTGWELMSLRDAKQLFAALPQCRPAWFLGVPRIWEKLRSSLLARFQAEAPDRRAMFERGLEAGLAKVRAEQAGQPVPPDAEAAWAEADAALFSTLRKDLGFDEVLLLMTGAAPMAAAVQEFFLAIGLPLSEGYGMSETAACGTSNPVDDIRLGTVGTPMPGTEIKLAEDGELLVRGPHVMRGYRNDPVKTREAIDEDGWLHSGDIATIEDGYVRIVDRKKELIINAAGKNMSPVNIESHLKSASPLIGQAVAIGDARPYNVALLVLDPDAAAAFATAHGLSDPSAAAVARDERVAQTLAAAVEQANAKLSRVEQVKRYELLDREWLPDGEELTPTMKLKRRAIAEKYGDVIEALYA